MALACTWGGFADTDVDFAEFFGSDHTVAVRFMLQHPKAYVGPMLSVNGTGNWLIGQGDCRASPKGEVKLLLRVGSQSLMHPVNVATATWHHLAVTRSGNNFRLYLDGTQVKHVGKFCTDVSAFIRDQEHEIWEAIDRDKDISESTEKSLCAKLESFSKDFNRDHGVKKDEEES